MPTIYQYMQESERMKAQLAALEESGGGGKRGELQY
jgi:hypothetical protein